jgi:signal transduction histidine kinase
VLEARADELEIFAQRVAHDLLSPLSAVSFALATVEKHHDDEPTRAVVTRAKRALGRSRDLVHGIFDFARAGAQPKPNARANVPATIRASIEAMLAGEAGSEPEVALVPFEDCDVACDVPVLSSMISNLLTNASKYSKESPSRLITIRVRASRTRVRVEVEDTGPGVPPGFEEAIFEPYVRVGGSGAPGLGLGLATVKRFATAHGGTVGARRGEPGAVFWFELPRAPEIAASRGEGTTSGDEPKETPSLH